MSGPVLRACGASIGVADTAHARRRSGDRAGAGRPRGGSGTPRGRAAIAGPTLEHPGYRGLRHGRIAGPDRRSNRPPHGRTPEPRPPTFGRNARTTPGPQPPPAAIGCRVRRVTARAEPIGGTPPTAHGGRRPRLAFPASAVGNDPEADSRASSPRHTFIPFVRFHGATMPRRAEESGREETGEFAWSSTRMRHPAAHPADRPANAAARSSPPYPASPGSGQRQRRPEHQRGLIRPPAHRNSG